MGAEDLIDLVSIGVVLVGDDGIIRSINSRGQRLLKVTKEEVLGKRVDMLPLRTPLYKVLSENCREMPQELAVNGSLLLVRSTEVVLENGVSAELVEFRDVTEEKRERRQREEFVAMMAHDLKSPLTVMMGYIQAMKGEMLGKVDQSLQSCLEELDRNSYRLLGMIDDVLDAYRLEVGLVSVNQEFSDLQAVLASCCRDLAREAEIQGIQFSSVIKPDIPAVRVDRKQIIRVFSNLVGNAIKFTPRKGSVSLTAERRGETVAVTVADTGIGIPEADLHRVFNKYYRASSARGYKGTGLGLAISKAIVEAHRGTIEVESREGTGSRFTVILPAE